MLSEFIYSWSLFHNTYLVGWFSGIALSIFSVMVVARNQIFVGAAISQASTLGISIALILNLSWFEEGLVAMVGSILFAIVAALTTTHSSIFRKETRETICGWVFLLSASGAIVLASNSPHGLEEVHRLITSSIVGASTRDTMISVVIAALSLILAYQFSRVLTLLVIDEEMARSIGVPVNRWNTFLSICLGVVVGLSFQFSGFIFTFGLLVLPGLIVKNIVRDIRSMFITAPFAAFVPTTVSFILANHYDYPPGQLVVLIMSLTLLLVWIFRFSR